MAQAVLRRGLRANLPDTVIDGTIWYTYDTGQVFFDHGNQRKCVNNIPEFLSELLEDDEHRLVTSTQIAQWTLIADKFEETDGFKHIQPDWAAVTGDAAILNKPLHYETTEYWMSHPELISERGHYYVFTDYVVKNNISYPNIKIGDGKAYIVDLPFIVQDVSTLLNNHIQNKTIHITGEERVDWNNKVSAIMSNELQETLILTTDNI